jgi:hypothetical protein
VRRGKERNSNPEQFEDEVKSLEGGKVPEGVEVKRPLEG